MKCLFFPHEQYVNYHHEAGNLEIRLPIIESGFFEDYVDFVYQREERTFGRPTATYKALDLLKSYNPDVVIYFTTWGHENIDPVVLQAAKMQGKPVVNIRFDSKVNYSVEEANTNSSSTHIAVFASISDMHRQRVLHEISPSYPKPFFVQGNNVLKSLFHPNKDVEKDIDVVFLGSRHGHRVEFLKKLENDLKSKGINFYFGGGNIDDTSNLITGHSGFIGATADFIPIEKYISILQRSKIALNIQTIPDHVTSIKGKVFEYLACGNLCLTDFNVELLGMVPKNVVEYYNDYDHCLRLILENLENNKYQNKSEFGHNWYNKNFDSTKFWLKSLQTIVEGEEFIHPEFIERDYQKVRRALLKDSGKSINFEIQI